MTPGALLGALGAVLGSSWELLGRSWGLLGRSWGSFWPPWGHFLELFWPLFSVPLKKRRNLEIRQRSHTKSLFFRCQGLPKWLQNLAKIDPGGFRKLF